MCEYMGKILVWFLNFVKCFFFFFNSLETKIEMKKVFFFFFNSLWTESSLGAKN